MTVVPELPDEARRYLTAKVGGVGDQPPADDGVDAWLDSHQGEDRPSSLDGMMNWFRKLVYTENVGRHDAMLKVLVVAMCEAAAGAYPARRACTVLNDLWRNSLERNPARDYDADEWTRMLRWAIQEAENDDHDARRLRMRRDYGTDTRDYAALIGGIEFRTNGEQQPNAEPEDRPRRFVGVSAAELAAPIPPMRWLVRGVWPERSAGVLAGEKKTFKTWNLQALAIAVASGKPYLSHFAVANPGPVLYLCGEGGRDGFANRYQVIGARYGIAASELSELPFVAEFDTAELTNPELMNGIRDHLDRLQPVLVILDPLYAYHPQDVEAANLYARGPMLAKLRESIEGHAALVIGDHFKKSASGTLDLDDISMAGVAQWADTWALQCHRREPDLAACRYFLDVEFSTRRAGGHRFEVDWQLDRDPDPELVSWSACQWSVNPAPITAIDAERALEQRIVQAVVAAPWTLNRKAVALTVGGRYQAVLDVVRILLERSELAERDPGKGTSSRAMVLGPANVSATQQETS